MEQDSGLRVLCLEFGVQGSGDCGEGLEFKV